MSDSQPSKLLHMCDSSGLWAVQDSSDMKKRNQSSGIKFSILTVLLSSSKDKKTGVLNLETL